jgi:hypothetical protein
VLKDFPSMSDDFTSTLLAALNESAEVNETDWRSVEAVLRGRADLNESGAPEPPASESRFAVIISSCMAKVLSGTST